uniref:Uncharacterized protein n=1 Tax=viral metagenome TaxID=1070528 RepID=A0A6C0KZ08_9ZZZZ
MNRIFMLFLYLITPLLGSIRNYSKYKQIHFRVFIRTPLIYLLIHSLFHCSVWQTLIYERWFFLLYKTSFSIYNDDYHKRKNKYIQKYGLKYSS